MVVSPLKKTLALLSLLALIAAGCGDGDDEEQAQTGDQTESSQTESDANGDGGCEVDPNATLRVMTAGGLEEEGIIAAFNEPFTEKTGVEVVTDSPHDLGRVKAQVESGNVTHDITLGEGSVFEQAKALDLLEKIDWDLVDPEPLREEAQDDYGIGFEYFSTFMAWNPEATKGEELTSWQEFFDTEKYPGRRAMVNYPTMALPIALLADGVPPEDLYPLDIDRGFEALERLAPDVTVWWDAGEQPRQLLTSGEVDFSSAWSGRIVTTAEEDEIDYTFSEGVLDFSKMGVIKGAPNYCEAMAYFHEVSKAENQATFAEIVAYTGGAVELEEHLPAEKLQWYPTTDENYEIQAHTDVAWWFEHGTEVDDRWAEFELAR